MLNNILKFSKQDFYQEKVARIAEAVNTYAQIKEKGAGEVELAAAGSQAGETLAIIMKESGFSEAENPYISLDREFFTPEGLPDQARLADFQKEIIKHYSMQQIKWSFAGTTSQFTSITMKNLEKQHIAYPDLLPLELKQAYLQKKKQQSSQPEPGKYKAFIYQDGSVSPEILPEKRTIRLDLLRNDSGFDFSSGYSPDNSVNKKNWIAGFNAQEEWEQIRLQSTGGFSAGNNVDPVAIFTGREKNGELGLFCYLDLAYLFDNLSLLMDGEEELYYSLSGELYGSRAVDKAKTLENLQQALKQHKVKKLRGIVLHNTSPAAVAFYKKLLGDYITPETEFYRSNDTELGEKLEAVKNQIREEDISAMVTSGFIQPSEKLLVGDALYSKLTPSTIEAGYTVPLDIFDSEKDLFTFLSLPDIQDVIEEDTIRYIKTVKVPSKKRLAYSNAVQNLLHNYRKLFSQINIPQQKLLETARTVIVDEQQPALLGKEKITGEKNFYDLIKAGSKIQPKTDIPSFTQAYKKDKDYYDIFDEKEQQRWWEAELKSGLPQDAFGAIKEILKGLEISEKARPDFRRALQNVLSEYQAVAASTGMTPAEIVGHVADVIAEKPESIRLRSKRIFFEKTLKDLITEAAADNPHRVEVRKEDLYNQDKNRLVWKPFSGTPNLFTAEDRQAFLTSPVIRENHFTDEDKIQIEEFLHAADVPEEQQHDFSREIINALRSYQYRLKPTGLKPAQALKQLARFRQQQPAGIKPELAAILKEAAGSKTEVIRTSPEDELSRRRNIPDQNQPAGLLDNLLRNNLAEFVTHPVVKDSGLTQEAAAELAAQVKKSRLPAAAKAGFKEAVYRILQNYQTELAAKGITVAAAVNAAKAALSGRSGAVPKELQPFIEKIIIPRDNVPRGAAAPVVPVTAAPTLNLFNEEDFMTFTTSPSFRNSGLSREELKQLLAEHQTAYQNRQHRFYGNVPLKFKEVPLRSLPREQQQTVPIPDLAAQDKRSANTAANLGWVQRQNQNGLRNLEFTPQAKQSLNPQSRQLISALAGTGKAPGAFAAGTPGQTGGRQSGQQAVSNQSGSSGLPSNTDGKAPGAFAAGIPGQIEGRQSGQQPFSNQSGNDSLLPNPAGETALSNRKILDLLRDKKPRVSIITPFDYNSGQRNPKEPEFGLKFTQPAQYMKSTGIQMEFNPAQQQPLHKQQQPFFNRSQPHTTERIQGLGAVNPNENEKKTPSEASARLSRIEENYNLDKRMLASSNNQGSGGAEQQAVTGKSGKNVINESAEDLLDLLIKKAHEDSI